MEMLVARLLTEMESILSSGVSGDTWRNVNVDPEAANDATFTAQSTHPGTDYLISEAASKVMPDEHMDVSLATSILTQFRL